jgi:hypothetical protein
MKSFVWAFVLFICSFAAGYNVSNIVRIQKTFTQTKHLVGTCLSNGLYFEKITGIRYSEVRGQASYELSPTINGRVSAPDVTEAWLVDESYTVVNPKNCL